MRTVLRSRERTRWLLGPMLILSLWLMACGGSTASPPTTTPMAAQTSTPAPTVVPDPSPTPDPTVTLPSSTNVAREIGVVEGITFVVGEGSEATFTVEEKLSSLPLPSDAVVRTGALSGEVHLDGRPSVIQIDLGRLESDQSRRDQYIRGTMFRNHPIATLTVDDVGPLPQGFKDGQEVAGQITGELDIRGVEVPITFDLEGRDDGDVIFILGRTSFVWADFGIRAPSIGRFVQVTDEVSAEILLALRPQ